MDSIIALDNGRIKSHGAFENLQSDINDLDPISETNDTTTFEESKIVKSRHSVDSQLTTEEVTGPGVTNLQRREGNWITYRYYFQSAGYISRSNITPVSFNLF